MKRSEINERLRDATGFFERHRFFLPPFAHWAPDDWPDDVASVAGILDRGLGWDVTDFGQGRFDELGLLLFTLRNGSGDPGGKPYAEKAMIVDVDQRTPMHYHWSKTEDIINRAGGRLMVRVYAADEDGGLASRDVTFVADGATYTVPAGHVVCLRPGESITLTPSLYHSFWAEGECVLAGEVSSVNDDARDNRFHEPLGRFPSVEEDQLPFRWLVSDYGRFER